MQKNNYIYEELIECGKGKLFGEGNAKLPLPPMLMFDRITKIEQNTGEFKKGFIKAELDIKDNLWFFDCHFQGDPVMPGCLGLDAMWQLVGFFLGWIGEPGKGRALGVNSVKFTGEVLKNIKSKQHKLFIVEGYTDVIAMEKAGFNSVAPLGTAVSQEQLNLAWQYNNCLLYTSPSPRDRG